MLTILNSVFPASKNSQKWFLCRRDRTLKPLRFWPLNLLGFSLWSSTLAEFWIQNIYDWSTFWVKRFELLLLVKWVKQASVVSFAKKTFNRELHSQKKRLNLLNIFKLEISTLFFPLSPIPKYTGLDDYFLGKVLWAASFNEWGIYKRRFNLNKRGIYRLLCRKNL